MTWTFGLHVYLSLPNESPVGLYETIITLPDYIINDDWLTIIVSGFEFLKKEGGCSSFQKCVEQYILRVGILWLRIIPSIPQTKNELKKCIIAKNCTTFKPSLPVHV